MVSWGSIDDVVGQFDLSSPSTDLAAILRELRDRLASIHPDRNGGEFPSANQKNEFLRVRSAIEYVESIEKSQTALVPISQVTALVEAINKSLAVRENQVNALSSTAQALTDVGETLRRGYYGPKLTSGVLLAASTALFVFMGSLQDNPVLGPLMEFSFFAPAVLTAWVSSGLLFLVFWYRERRVESQAEYLLSDEALAELFPELCWLANHSAKKGAFTPREFAEVILEWWQRTHTLEHRHGSGNRLAREMRLIAELPKYVLQGSTRISQAVAMKVARSHIRRLIERHVVRKLEDPDVTEWYEIDSLVRSRY